MAFASLSTISSSTTSLRIAWAVGDGEWVVHNECNRPRLRANIGLQTGDPYQAQHIIPCELAFGGTPNRLLDQAVSSNSFDINGRDNGIALPPDASFAEAWGLPYHLGSHGDYTKYVRGLLEQLDEQLSSFHGGAANIPNDVAGREVTNLARSLEDAYWELGRNNINQFFDRAGDCINGLF